MPEGVVSSSLQAARDVYKRQVTTSAQEREWLDLPKKIYKGNCNWVCPLDQDITEVFDPARNELLSLIHICDPLGTDYNVNQSKIAIGSGGFLGKGFLQGTQIK